MIKDGPLFEIAVNPMNDVTDELSCELLVMSELIIPWRVGEKLLEVAIVNDMLQKLQLTACLLQKHVTVYLVPVKELHIL